MAETVSPLRAARTLINVLEVRFGASRRETEEEQVPEECKNHQANLERCNCTYEPCSRKGCCCECLEYHRRMGELPACCFPAEVERTYDRSIRRFMRCQ
jgi:hypothetical protein